ncbi:MAG: Phosphatidylglycerol/phosphatidylinositol transfer protein [Trichoglossum hirsutum]|nr:MAG: Phosphatidylglycerol/phosphatidylinositol transfer protein [Trichoglossum hirsutum]
MKLRYTLLSLLLSPLVTADSLSFFGNSQRVLDNAAVPGDSPLVHCSGELQQDILEIVYVDLKPNPPRPGATLEIEALGILKKDVVKGAYVDLQVKYGLIRVVNTRADLCEQIKNVDLKCPLKEGKTLLTKSVDIPKEIPPGKYTVVADVFTGDHESITCLTAEIYFKAG